MTDISDSICNLISNINIEVDKRDFLIKKVNGGESISNSKTPWTEKRLEEASDNVINKLYETYKNPPPTKINPKEALELGKPACPIVIDMYAEGLEGIVASLPYFGKKYRINVEKLKTSMSRNEVFCENLAIKIGSKIIEQLGDNSKAKIGVSLATMTWNAIEKVEVESKLEVDISSMNKSENE